jgi:hypothetical protein
LFLLFQPLILLRLGFDFIALGFDFVAAGFDFVVATLAAWSAAGDPRRGEGKRDRQQRHTRG